MADAAYLTPAQRAELDKIEKRRRVAEIMQFYGTTPYQGSQVVSGRVVFDPFTPLAKIAQTYFGGKQVDTAESEAQKLYNQAQEQRTKELKGFFAPSEQPLPPDQAGPPQPVPVTREDLAKRMLESQNPQFQAMGVQMGIPEAPKPMTIAPGATYGMAQNGRFSPSYTAPSKESGPTPLPGVPGLFAKNGKIQDASGRELSSEEAQRIALQMRAAGRQVTNIENKVNAYTPASEAAQTEFMKSSRATYDQLKNAKPVLENIEKAKALIPSAKGFMGPGGESMLEAAKFLNNRLGMSVDTAGVKSAEELRSRIFFQIMENLKKMDAQPSQMQQVMMRDALGKLGTDPSALANVLDAYGDVVRGKVESYNQEAQGAIERGVKFPYDPVIKLPPKSASSGPARPRAVNPQTGEAVEWDGKQWIPVQR